VLQVKGYQSIESETAEGGLKLAVEKHPALILMDIQRYSTYPSLFFVFFRLSMARLDANKSLDTFHLNE